MFFDLGIPYWVLALAAALILTFNVLQFLLAYRNKKKAQEKIAIFNKKMDVIQADLEKEKLALEKEIKEKLSKLSKKPQ
jgi:uncharacterized membrane protein